jgi:hypothetical protein
MLHLQNGQRALPFAKKSAMQNELPAIPRSKKRIGADRNGVRIVTRVVGTSPFHQRRRRGFAIVGAETKPHARARCANIQCKARRRPMADVVHDSFAVRRPPICHRLVQSVSRRVVVDDVDAITARAGCTLFCGHCQLCSQHLPSEIDGWVLRDDGESARIGRLCVPRTLHILPSDDSLKCLRGDR